MERVSGWVGVVSLGVSSGMVAAAEPPCAPQDTVAACWERYLPAQPARAAEKSVAAAQIAAREKLENFETGLDGGAPALATTTRNFLPLLSMAGLISDSDGEGEDNLFTVDLNFLIPTLGEDRNAQLKAVLNTQPALFAPLHDAFEGISGGADRAAELQSELDAGDDYTIAFAYSHINERFGRSFARYRRRFVDLFEAAQTRATAAHRSASSGNALTALVTMLGDDVDLDGPLSQKPGLQHAVEQAARTEAALEEQLQTMAASHALSTFAELVNNQPQLTVGFDFRERDDRVGVRERLLKLAYEFGLANISQMERAAGGACDLAAAERENADLAAECLSRYGSYVERNQTRLRNADRFVAELSYADIGDYAYRADGVVVERGGSHRLAATLGYGRTLRVLGANRESRLDLVAAYEDYRDDPDRRDRLLATLTLTTKMNGVSIPVSLVYANHGEFLPEVDEEVSAHIGIKFALDSTIEE